jgi:pimeloyl-ACP methyl ester carboxylesterase
VFNRLYPADVAGVVFVDSSYEYETNAIPTHTQRFSSLPDTMYRFGAWAAEIVYRVGVFRLFSDPPNMRVLPKGFTPQEWITAHAFQVRGGAATAKEIYEQCREEAIAAGTFGDRPLIVLTAGLPTQVGTSPVEERRILREQQVLIQLQGDLAARLSTRSKQVVVHDARHTIHYDRPDVVIGGVREVVEEARASR